MASYLPNGVTSTISSWRRRIGGKRPCLLFRIIVSIARFSGLGLAVFVSPLRIVLTNLMTGTSRGLSTVTAKFLKNIDVAEGADVWKVETRRSRCGMRRLGFISSFVYLANPYSGTMLCSTVPQRPNANRMRTTSETHTKLAPISHLNEEER